MNKQHSVWIMTQVTPWETMVMSETILSWKAALLIRDISVFSKGGLCWLLFKTCLVHLGRACMHVITSSRPWREQRQFPNDPTSGIENVPPLAWRRGNLAWVCILYMLTRWSSTVRSKEMDSEQDIADQNSYLFPSFNGVCSIPGRVYFTRCDLQQDNRIPVGIE